MILYANPLSPNCARVLVTAAQLGLDLEMRHVDLAKGEHKAPAYLALNPMGQVPTLVDGEAVLTESRAIMTYLCDRAGGSPLWPQAPAARAQVLRWLFWEGHHLSPHTRAFQWENMFKPMLGLGAPDEAALKTAEGPFTQALAILEAALEASPFVAGPEPTLADLSVASTLMHAEPARMPVAAFPKLQGLRARMMRAPAWRTVYPAAAEAVPA